MLCQCEDSEIENYGYDPSLYACPSEIDIIVSELQITSSKLFSWFYKFM